MKKTFLLVALAAFFVASGANADVRPLTQVVTGAPTATLSGTEALPVVSGGVVKQTTTAKIGALLLSSPNTWLATQNFGAGFQINGISQTFPASAVLVGTSDAQTLTNKTLAAAAITGAGQFSLSGAGSTFSVAPASLGSLDNVTIGGTTPGAGTFTTIAAQRFLLGFPADQGGGQKLQVAGSGYFSGGVSVGTPFAASGGVVVANAISNVVPGSAIFQYNSGQAQLYGVGANTSTYGEVLVGSLNSDNTLARTATLLDANGNTQLPGSLTLGASPTLAAASGTIQLGAVATKGYTVATLPTGTAGARAHVTDATACSFGGALTGGGAVFCPVVYNGSAWVGG